jgi:hypothetical protein
MERLVYYGARGLPLAICVVIGVGAFISGLQRFGKPVKVSLWWVFGMFWVAVFAIGYLGGEVGIKPLGICTVAFIGVGIVFWLISLVFSLFKRSRT